MSSPSLGADLVIVNGVVHALDEHATRASNIAMKDGRIIAIGTHADDVASVIDDHTNIIDAQGGAVLPGFIETHAHFQKEAISRAYLLGIDAFGGPTSVEGLLDLIRRRAAETPVGDWIWVNGYVPATMPAGERRMPTRAELDLVAPGHPAAVVGIPSVPTSANSIALERAGIDRDTTAPEGGFIERTTEGEITGILHGPAKLRLDPRNPATVLPRFSPAERAGPALDLIRSAVLTEGITSMHDMATEPDEVATWLLMRREGTLPIRVQMLMRGVGSRLALEHLLAIGLSHGFGDEWLRIGGVKLSIDGIDHFRDAATYEAYPGEPDNRGSVFIPQPVLDDAIAACHEAGVRVIVHAIGQRAVDMALDAFERAFVLHGRKSWVRHRLEHAHLPPRPGQVDRIRRLGLSLGMQPIFLWAIGRDWIDIWGETNLNGIMPIRQMLAAGIPVFGGTDCFGMPISPLLSIKTAVTRRSRFGDTIAPNEAISMGDAVRMWTTFAARAAGEELEKGSLEIGKLGDVVVLSSDPFAMRDPAMLDEINVQMTIVHGRIRHSNGELAAVV